MSLLKTLALIVLPFLKRHNLAILTLSEMDVDNEEHKGTFGLNHTMHDKADPLVCRTIEIQLLLRSPVNKTEFLPLDLLLANLCHELGHCWHCKHDLKFYRKCRSVVQEVEHDLGYQLRIRPYIGFMRDAGPLMLLEFGDDAAPKALKHTRGRSCRTAIHAANKWQRRHGKTTFFQAPLTERFDLERYK